VLTNAENFKNDMNLRDSIFFHPAVRAFKYWDSFLPFGYKRLNIFGKNSG